MFRPTCLVSRTFQVGGRCWAAAAVVCLGLAGCSSLMDLRGEKFQPDPTLEMGQHVRVPDQKNEFFGFSNKARQIEQNVGVR